MSAGKKSFWEMDELRLVTGAMVILGGATGLLVVMPYLLLENIQPPEGLKPYTSDQLIGRQSYIANGCVYCHSQQPRDIKQAPDATRGWGRASVAGDYAYDTPHLLGTMRTGPDLLNIGARQPSKDWQLGHLYQPRAYTPGSIMPSYPFLFELRQGAAKAGETVVNLPPGLTRPGQVVVAKPEALALVSYLLSLDRTYPALPPLPVVPTPDKDKP
jgi:cytochrome c oxidase cbb3-type subunit 2